jgi:predicted RNA-binding protein with PIN domain
LNCTFDGYEPCHNAEEIIQSTAYDPTADLENTPHSVFCAHGAGFVVPWNEVEGYKHLEANVSLTASAEAIIPKPAKLANKYKLSDDEIEALMLRSFGPIRRKQYSEPRVNSADGKEKKRRKSPSEPQKRMVIVDGYNVIYAWDSLKEIAEFSLEKARESLMDLLSNYVAFTKTELTLVFDAYLVKDGTGTDFTHDGYRIVYTKQDQTADAYIEKMMHELGPNYNIQLVTGDKLLQFSAVHSGILRMTAKEFEAEVNAVGREINDFIQKLAQDQK